MLAKIMAACIAAIVVTVAPCFADDPPPIFVGGQFIRQHAIEDARGHLLVPVRGVFEAFGASVTYTAPRFVVVRKNDAVIAGLVVDRRTAVVANRRRYLDVTPIRHGGRIYVPLRSIAEIAGATVAYSTKPRLVDIRVPNNVLRGTQANDAAGMTDDTTLPLWAYALVGVCVLGFMLELGRRVAGVAQRRPRLAGAALQLPYSAGARNQHRIGKITK